MANRRPRLETTHVTAYIQERLEPNDIHVFRFTHLASVDVREALKAAFADWLQTDHGRMYFVSNLRSDTGANWGDAFEIPRKILKKHGIVGIATMNFKNKLIVNHDEILFANPLEIAIEIQTGG